MGIQVLNHLNECSEWSGYINSVTPEKVKKIKEECKRWQVYTKADEGETSGAYIAKTLAKIVYRQSLKSLAPCLLAAMKFLMKSNPESYTQRWFVFFFKTLSYLKYKEVILLLDDNDFIIKTKKILEFSFNEVEIHQAAAEALFEHLVRNRLLENKLIEVTNLVQKLIGPRFLYYYMNVNRAKLPSEAKKASLTFLKNETDTEEDNISFKNCGFLCIVMIYYYQNYDTYVKEIYDNYVKGFLLSSNYGKWTDFLFMLSLFGWMLKTEDVIAGFSEKIYLPFLSLPVQEESLDDLFPFESKERLSNLSKYFMSLIQMAEPFDQLSMDAQIKIKLLQVIQYLEGEESNNILMDKLNFDDITNNQKTFLFNSLLQIFHAYFNDSVQNGKLTDREKEIIKNIYAPFDVCNEIFETSTDYLYTLLQIYKVSSSRVKKGFNLAAWIIKIVKMKNFQEILASKLEDSVDQIERKLYLTCAYDYDSDDSSTITSLIFEGLFSNSYAPKSWELNRKVQDLFIKLLEKHQFLQGVMEAIFDKFIFYARLTPEDIQKWQTRLLAIKKGKKPKYFECVLSVVLNRITYNREFSYAQFRQFYRELSKLVVTPCEPLTVSYLCRLDELTLEAIQKTDSYFVPGDFDPQNLRLKLWYSIIAMFQEGFNLPLTTTPPQIKLLKMVDADPVKYFRHQILLIRTDKNKKYFEKLIKELKNTLNMG